MDLRSRLSASYTIFLTALLIWGCSGEKPKVPKHISKLDNLNVYPADAAPLHDITFEQQITYRDTEEIMFSPRIGKVVVDNRDRVYILDYRQNKIPVFDSDGSYLQSVGRKGRGPGEFLSLSEIQVGDRNLHVLDTEQTKVSVFDLETFEHVKDVNISFEDSENKPSWLERTRKNRTYYQPNDFFSLSEGNYLITFSDNGVAIADNLPGRTYEMSLFNPEDGKYTSHNVLSFDWTGGVLIYDHDEVRRVIFRVPYKRTSQYDYSNGQLVYGWTEDFLFKFYDMKGNYQRAFYYPFEKNNLTEDEAATYYEDETSIAAVRNDTLAETWPAFKSVLLDDENRVWVSTFTENTEELEWMVFKPSGKLLAKFRWPEGRNLKEVKNGCAYILSYGQSGLPKITRYVIEMNQASS